MSTSKTIYRQKHWDLGELLAAPDPALVDQRLAEIGRLVERLEKGRGLLGDGV